MTNLEIIVAEAIAHKIYTQEEVESMLEAGQDLNINTFARWKALGYKVKKGEHAKIVTKLWKCRKGTAKIADTAGNEVEQETKNMYLVKAYLFTADQVELMT